MCRRLILVAWTALLAGCARSERGVVLSAVPHGEARANLVMARAPETAALATRMSVRSDWPSVDHGYRFDDVTYYSTIRYDEQSFYDRYGGLLYVNEGLRTGVWVR